MIRRPEYAIDRVLVLDEHAVALTERRLRLWRFMRI